MSLDALGEAVETAYSDLDDLAIELDAETRNELAVLVAALDQDDAETLVHRAIHLLYQTTVDTGKLDLHLRRNYDVNYDEYLSGMTFEEMTGAPGRDDGDRDRRYQF